MNGLNELKILHKSSSPYRINQFQPTLAQAVIVLRRCNKGKRSSQWNENCKMHVTENPQYWGVFLPEKTNKNWYLLLIILLFSHACMVWISVFICVVYTAVYLHDNFLYQM